MLQKIYISGAHLVGKTTLCENLQNQLRIEGTKLIFCQEVAKTIYEEKSYTPVSNHCLR